MKKTITRHGGMFAAAIVASLLLPPSGRANGDKVVAPALAREVVVDIPLSVFRDDASGIDPFYPNAQYRVSKKPQLAEVAPVNELNSGVLKDLKLNGMGGVGERSWALVNGISMYVGEVTRIPVGGKAYELICLEVKQRSVVIGIKDTNIQRELKLD